MPEMDVHLFGYPEFLIDGRPIHFERRKTTALLAYLASESDPSNSVRPGISRDVLAALFWPDRSQEQAGAYLRQSLWECTRLLGDAWIQRQGGIISLNLTANIQIDTRQFEADYQQWKMGGSQAKQSNSQLTELVGLYRGEFLAGFNLKDCPDFDNWQALQRETLRLHMAQALEAVIQSNIAGCDMLQAETNARKWLALDPLNEAAHRALMSILEQNGMHSAAVRQFDICCSTLQDELGIEPEPQTLALISQIQKRQLAMPGKEMEQAPAHLGKGIAHKPSGTITFVFTDIQGSTHLWEHQKGAMQYAFQRHEEIVRSVMAAHGGFVYKMIGDAFQVAFDTAKDALSAALEAQLTLRHESWDASIGELTVRMALHTGVTEERGDDYVGPVLNRVARLLSTGYGGQVLLTEATYQLVREEMPAEVMFKHLGDYHLRDLVQPEKIYQVTTPGLTADFPPLKAESTRALKIPSQNTPFIGREGEMARISEMLSDPACRLLTLHGIGGCGKTRLAIQAAKESRGFKDGVFFCSLATVNSVHGIILAIADAVDLFFYAPHRISIAEESAREQLFQYLANKEGLIVLDNFEQIAPCAGFINDLLDAAPGIKAMVTSRQALNLPGEWVLEVGGLSFPSHLTSEPLLNFPAVRLFVNTAERNSAFRPSPEDMPAILEICQLLEGIPLALEMSATWTRMLTCAEIAGEIERNQDFLSTSWRGMPERHRTLRAVFEHSWQLLSDIEQTAFSRLSIFRAGFTREAALVGAETPLPLISSLMDKALIRRSTSGRFEIHPLLRRYAEEKLAMHPQYFDETRLRVVDYYTDWLARTFDKLKGKEYLSSLAAIRSELPNLALAMEWLIKQTDVERLSRVFPTWILYYVMNDCRFDMHAASRLMIDLADHLRPQAVNINSLDAIMLALTDASICFFNNDDIHWEQIELYHRESMRLIQAVPDHIHKAFAILLICSSQGNMIPAEAVELSRQCIRLFEKLGDAWGTAMAHMAMGDICLFNNISFEDARAAYTRGLQDFTRLSSDWGRALCLTGMMILENNLGNTEEANKLGTQSLAIYDQMGSYERMIYIRHTMAEIAIKRGAPREAIGFYQANLDYFMRYGDEAAQQFYRDKLAELAEISQDQYLLGKKLPER